MWWLLIFVICLIAEIISVSLTSIWFAAGALAAFAVSLFCDMLWVQILIFLLVSLILLIFTKPVAERYLNQSREKTNIDAVVGKQGIVMETIDNLQGKGGVSLSGQMWTARSADDNIKIEKDTKVLVKEIQGVKLIVEPMGNNL